MKKILTSLAILATVFGMTSVAMAKSFTDVKNTKYEGAVNILTDLKIVNGYEDGTYKPNNSVKRSEMAKLIVVAMGKENSAKTLAGNTNFSDVPANHWASGYINLASSLGLIKGYPDGSFKPDATVSYVEASTMLLRALDYGKELEGLSWPTGYMSKANSAGILTNVTANNSSDAAIRGNVASMILNTLKGSTRKVVASNNSGNVYGDSTILMEKTFDNLTYVKKGKVVDIDADSETLVIEDTGKNRRKTVTYTDDSTIKKMFGREVSFIYDEDAEDFLSFEILDKYTVKVVNVDEIDEDEDIIIDEDGNEYDLPKSSNILYIGATRYEDVEKAYITFDEKKKVAYVLLEGSEKIYVGIITDKDIKVNDKKGIEVFNTDGDYEELVLANSSAKIYEGNVILYTYNNDEKIVIKTQEDVDDAEPIEYVSKTAIQLEDEDKITFSSTSDYEIYFIEDSEIEVGKLADVDEEYDRATILKYGDKYYLLIFIDSVDVDDIKTDVSVSEAKKALNTALTTAKKKKEASYSVVTYEKLRDAIEYGEKIYASASSYSSAKIQLATKDINDALNGLKAATSADKELRLAYEKLQSKIKEAGSLDAKDYTATSYKAVTDAVTAAKKIVIESTTVAKVTTATNNITTAINLLVTNASAAQIVEATTRLDKAITDAKTKKAADYTEASYKVLTTALTAANKVDRTTAGARELNNVASNLEAAIDALVPVQLANYKKERDSLDANMKIAMEKNETAYTTSTWEIFEDLRATIKKDYDALASYDDVKLMTNANIITQTNKVKDLNTKIQDALGDLVLKTDETLRKNSLSTIEQYLEKAETYADADAWNETNPPITWEALQNKITNAKKMITKPEDYTTKELQDMANELMMYITL